MASEHLDSQETSSTSLVEESLTITFEDISYIVGSPLWAKLIPKADKKSKIILDKVSGIFNAGELSVILGPSGAGKSTLMDVLAGYSKPTAGRILINGQERNEKKFRRRSCYILQDDKIQDMLTVRESLDYAADLKLGTHISHEQKKQRVNEIIHALGLNATVNTKSLNLSGGQRKRLAIGLELVNDPQIMFLDEPTSGLDISMSKQIVRILQFLARQGRTVVVTMHQPSASLLSMVDKLYAVVGGKCAYLGAETQLRPYLEQMNLKCPAFHNPVDFLIEICEENTAKLVEKSENGRNTQWMTNISRKCNSNLTVQYRLEEEVSLKMLPAPKEDPNRKTLLALKSTYATSYRNQITILTRRSLKTIWRDPWFALRFIFVHIAMGLFIGLLYYKIGDDGYHVQYNIRYLQYCLLFLMFTTFSAITVRFPEEIPVIRREHFNRWYSAEAYYLSTVVSILPLQTSSTIIFAALTYILTGQPKEWLRFTIFSSVLLMVTYVALCKGLMIGAMFNVKNGVIFGPFFIMPYLILSGIFIKKSHAYGILLNLFKTSFINYGFVGLMLSIFGKDRKKLKCSNEHIYCYFTNPKAVLHEYDVINEDYISVVMALFGIGTTAALIAFIILKIRLRNKW